MAESMDTHVTGVFCQPFHPGCLSPCRLWAVGEREEDVHVGSMSSGPVKDQAHGDHLGELEAMLLEEGL
jgi:hypothetical protein